MNLKKFLTTSLLFSMLFTVLIPSLNAAAAAPVEQQVVNQNDNAFSLVSELKFESQPVAAAPLIIIVMRAAALAYGTKKTYDRVTEAIVESAINNHFDVPMWANYSYNVAEISVQGKNKTINFEFGNSGYGMEHILSKHHPKYWTGLGYGEYNSFFIDSTSIGDIVTIVNTVVNESAANKNKAVLASLSKENTAIDGTWNGDKYRVVLDKDLDVITCYPLGWNVADSE
ncbi:hypothetical protein NQ117_13050 [Paenibacillus sp. SC116]|uniref:hypothetical protein n=1 Tax=Paenibacillus sp. SC116 TaxID=2968986 RepID=UPI00215B602F|nr:hypothetical protein [Paenibacillus sp. SC116]MCR8844612.1 hypothetical protein [Paenibacillus sp. SC116]